MKIYNFDLSHIKIENATTDFAIVHTQSYQNSDLELEVYYKFIAENVESFTKEYLIILP